MTKQGNNILFNTYNSGYYLKLILTKYSFYHTRIIIIINLFNLKRLWIEENDVSLTKQFILKIGLRLNANICQGQLSLCHVGNSLFIKSVFPKKYCMIIRFPISSIYVVNADFLKSSLQIGWKYKNKTLPCWQSPSRWKTLSKIWWMTVLM